MASGLHYFGMSVAGGLDFNGDGLADITVGSRDRAAVLRYGPPLTSCDSSPSLTQWVLQIPSTKGGRKYGERAQLLGSTWVSLLLSSEQYDFEWATEF